jgi:hypothetical protein
VAFAQLPPAPAGAGNASLSFPSTTTQRYIQLLAIDGVAQPTSHAASPSRLIPAGSHTIIVRVIAGERSLAAEIDFTAQANAKYQVLSRFLGYGASVTLEDGSGGRVFAQGCEAEALCTAATDLPRPAEVRPDRGPYKAPALADSQAAYVYVPRGTPRRIDIERVDGFRPELKESSRGDEAGPLVLTPGKHILVVSMTSGGQLSGTSTIWLIAVPGETYDVDYRAPDSHFSMFLVSRFGRKTGGYIGSDDEP